MESKSGRQDQKMSPQEEASTSIEKLSPLDVVDAQSSDDEARISKIVYPPVFSRSVIVFGLMLATFLVALDMSIVGTAIPKITTEFNSMSDEGWYGSAFFLGLATFVSVWGKAYKYFSLRIVYLTAILVFEIGSLVCAVSPSSTALIVGRAIQGAGAAGTTNGGYTIAAFVVPPRLVPIVIGLIGSVFTVASVIGPLLGGVFTSYVTWRWCFYINLPIGGVTAICMLIFFRTPAHAKKNQNTPMKKIMASLDPIGLLLMPSSILCLFLALQWGGVAKAWNSSVIIGLLVGCVALLGCFIVNEYYQGDRALIVFRILSRRTIAACSGFIFFFNAANVALQYNLPVFFQANQGNSPVESGLKMIPAILSTAIATIFSSASIGKLRLIQPFLLAAGALATLGAGLIYTFHTETGLGRIIGYQILFGVGTGTAIQIPNLVATTTSSSEDVSTAIATVSFFLLLAGGWGVAASSAIQNNLILQRLPYYVPNINPMTVLAAGAGGVKESFYGEERSGVQLAYLDGLHGAWIFSACAFGIAFLFAFAPKWPGRISTGANATQKDKETTSCEEGMTRG